MPLGNTDSKMSKEGTECFHTYILMLENKLFRGTYFLSLPCQTTLEAFRFLFQFFHHHFCKIKKIVPPLFFLIFFFLLLFFFSVKTCGLVSAFSVCKKQEVVGNSKWFFILVQEVAGNKDSISAYPELLCMLFSRELKGTRRYALKSSQEQNLCFQSSNSFWVMSALFCPLSL